MCLLFLAMKWEGENACIKVSKALFAPAAVCNPTLKQDTQPGFENVSESYLEDD